MKKNDTKKLRKIAKIFSLFSISFFFVTISIVTPFMIFLNKNIDPTYSSEYQKNKEILSDFVNNFTVKNDNKKLVISERFETAFKFTGDEKTKNNMTVLEAYENNLFSFTNPSIIEFYTKQKGIEVNFFLYNPNQNILYVTPNTSDSTIPNFYISFSLGKGKNQYSKIVPVGSSRIYGFKQSENQIRGIELVNKIQNSNIEKIVPGIDTSSFILDKKFYDASNNLINNTFAKTITKDDLTLSPLIEKYINDYKIKLNITNVYQDNLKPSNLIVSYEFQIGDYNYDLYWDTYSQITLTDFFIEIGADDPKTKVKNFIGKESDILELSDSIIIKKSDNNDNYEIKDKTIEQVKIDNRLEFKLSSLSKSKASSAGVEIAYENISFPKPGNSNVLQFEVVIFAGKNTSLYYEERIVIDSSNLIDFKISKPQEQGEIIQNILSSGVNNNILLIEPMIIPSFITDIGFNGNVSFTFLNEYYNKVFLENINKNYGQIFNNNNGLKNLANGGVNSLPTGINQPLGFTVTWTKPPTTEDPTGLLNDLTADSFSIGIRSMEISGDGSEIELNLDVYIGDVTNNAYKFEKSIILKNNNLISDIQISDNIITEFEKNVTFANVGFSYKLEQSVYNNLQEFYNNEYKLNGLNNVVLNKLNFFNIPTTGPSFEKYGIPSLVIEDLGEGSIDADTLTIICRLRLNYWLSSLPINVQLKIKLDANNKITISNFILNNALNITAKQGIINVTQANIDAMISVTNDQTKLDALKLLFEGTDLTVANLANFAASFDATNNLITLTANQGYSFLSHLKLEVKINKV
ncbi:MAG: hypothetical protein ACRC9U_02065 [Metamycoplasmataceae bacterium]